MFDSIEKFGNLHIARRASGEPVELVRSPDEVTFLAFDQRIQRLVELHVLRGGGALSAEAKRSAFERAKQASEIRGPTFLRILEVGEDDGLVYYVSNLNDGEFGEDYVARRGALLPAASLSLVFQLLDDLLRAGRYERLIARMRLDRVLVSTLEDTFLHLKVFDYGLSAPEQKKSSEDGDRDLVIQVSRLLFLLMTGEPYVGQSPESFSVLTSLPMSLRITIRTALTDRGNAPTSIAKVRDDVREAFSALVSSIQARNTRKQLVVTPEVQPRSQLQDLLLENVPIETILGRGFRVDAEANARRYPFSFPATNLKTGQQISVHLLPPSRIVNKELYEAVPLQMWRFSPERHPNILRSLSVWESPDWTFLTEEREAGFTLSRLMAERVSLNPQEIVVLLKQVSAGLEQAVECGVPRVDLHPSNILLQVGKPGPTLAREHERLMQKRLDAWPPFLVKLRPHLTMRSLYEPLLVDRPQESDNEEIHLIERDFRHRAFVALTAYLMTGDRQMGDDLQFSEMVPGPVAEYVKSCLSFARSRGKTPSPGEFLARFEEMMSAPEGPDLATRLRGESVAIEDMESVGAVSDFDDEWSEVQASSEPETYAYYGSGGGGWMGIGAVAVAVVLGVGVLAWWLLSDRDGGLATAPARAEVEAEVASVANPDADAAGAEPKEPVGELLDIENSKSKAEKSPLVPPELAKPGSRVAAMDVAAKSKKQGGKGGSDVAKVEPEKSSEKNGDSSSKPKKGEPKPSVADSSDPAATALDPVMIRKAILPSPEEIEEFKAGDKAPEDAPE